MNVNKEMFYCTNCKIKCKKRFKSYFMLNYFWILKMFLKMKSYDDWMELKKRLGVNISVYEKVFYCFTILADFHSKCRMMCEIGDIYKKEIKVNCGKIITLCSWAPQGVVVTRNHLVVERGYHTLW